MARRLLNVVVFFWALVGVILAALLLTGCGGPPESLSLDTSFTPTEVAAIADARDQWCAANGWCPYFVTDGEWHIVRETGKGPLLPGQDRAGGHTDQSEHTTYIDGDMVDSWPEMFWIIIAHELGHVQGIDHHGRVGDTMYWRQDEPSYELTGE